MKSTVTKNNKNVHMKAHTRTTFNTESPKKTLFSFECRGLLFQVNAQSLKQSLQGPIVFVFNQHKNAWAYDFISGFKASALEWMPEGQEPEYDCIEVGESQNDLEAKLHKNRFFRQDNPHGILLVTIGDIASAKVARYRAAYGRYDVAQLFCVQGDPETLELVDEGGRLLANTNGVYGVEARSLDTQVRTLKSLSPGVRSVAVLVSSKDTDDLAYEQKNQSVQNLTLACRKYGMKATKVHLLRDMDVATDMKPFTFTHQAFIGVLDDVVYGKAKELADFCDKEQIVFMASDLPSVAQGAAIGFGTAPRAYVAELIGLMAQQKDHQLPFHRLELAALEESPQMQYNLRGVRRQVRDLTQEKDDLLSMLNIQAS